MIDIVKEFNTIADTLDYQFDFGTRAMLNLIKSKEHTDNIYFLLSSPITWTGAPSSYGIGNSIASGNFLLLKRSKFGEVIYKTKDSDKDKTKYNKNLVPLLSEIDKIKNQLICNNLQVNSWTVIDAYDVFDKNFDGFIVTFTIEQA